MTAGAGERQRRRRRRARRRLATLGLAVVVCALVAGVVAATVAPGTTPIRPRATHGRAGDHRSPRPATFLGPYGTESRAIIAENKKPGTTAWKIRTEPPTGYIEGWAGTTYASVGQTVALYVSTTAPGFHVVAYRMGYYHGLGAREVWHSAEVPGRVQPTCQLTPAVNMVSCDNWARSLTVPITRAFVQGDYLFKLVGSANQQSYVLLTVFDPKSTAAYLVVARSLTEEGWNAFGGYDFYQGEGACTLGQTGSYPPCNRARIVSFDRPYSSGTGASDFFGNEYPLVRFMEEHGLDVAYCTDVTVSQHPTIVLRHRALLSLGHDETWTASERTAAQNGLAHGVNIVFFGAAPIVRHARLQPSPLGPDREEVDYRNPTEDPLNGTGSSQTVTGNTFATPPTNWPPTEFVGGEYSGYVLTGAAPAPFVVSDASAWVFDGTGLSNGSSIPGVISSDIDHLNPAATPSDLQVLGHSPIPLSEVYTNQGDWNGDTYSDMTYYTDPTSEAGVFETGTVSWISRLSTCAPGTSDCPAAMVGRITGNLLRLFGQGPAGRIDPPVANWQSVVPPGS